MHYLLGLFLPCKILLELLKAPEAHGDGAAPELHLMNRGHEEGGGEQEAAQEPDHHGEHPEVPRRDAGDAPRLALLPRPPDVGRADPRLAGRADDNARGIHFPPLDQESAAVREAPATRRFFFYIPLGASLSWRATSAPPTRQQQRPHLAPRC